MKDKKEFNYFFRFLMLIQNIIFQKFLKIMDRDVFKN